MGMDESLLTGESVLTAAQGAGGGGGGGSTAKAVALAFSGLLIDGESGTNVDFAANIGTEQVAAGNNQVDPIGFPVSARTINTLRACVPGGAASTPITFTLYKNGVATAVTCTIPASSPANTTAADTAHSVSFVDGDRLDVRVSAAAPMGANVGFSGTVEGPAGGGGGGGGGGSIALIQSIDGTLRVTSGSGPTVDLGNKYPRADWIAARRAAIDPLASGLTYRFLDPANNIYPVAGGTPSLVSGDPGIIGGAVAFPSGQYRTFTGVILTDPTTQKHAWAVRGRFTPPHANFQGIGLTDSTSNVLVNLASATSYDATKLCLALSSNGGAVGAGTTLIKTTHVVDGLPHVYSGVFSGTTYYALVDDVIVGSTNDVHNLSVANMMFTGFNGTADDVWISDLLYGF